MERTRIGLAQLRLQGGAPSQWPPQNGIAVECAVHGSLAGAWGSNPAWSLFRGLLLLEAAVACEHLAIDGYVELRRIELRFRVCQTRVFPLDRQPRTIVDTEGVGPSISRMRTERSPVEPRTQKRSRRGSNSPNAVDSRASSPEDYGTKCERVGRRARVSLTDHQPS